MRRRLRKAACALPPALLIALATPSAANAQIAFAPCKEDNNFACAHLKVPLDASGAVPGTISLALRRHRAPLGESHTAIIALAGGPGQPALPFAEEFTELLGPVAAGRDLIAFDQRGIGESHALKCKAFTAAGRDRSLRQAVASCGAQLGPTRSFYTTADTVADIEAIRSAGGYEKLVLYGTSYGTKVAEDYASAYPERVEALLLDSVVPPTGPDALNRATFAAIPRVLRQLCARRLCAHITADPVGDLRQVLTRTRHGRLRAEVLSAKGKPSSVSVPAVGIFDMLLFGDFSDLLRAELVTDVSAAARGDEAPIARLWATLRGVESGGVGEEFDLPLYYATVCEELSFPFNRSAPAATRLAEGRAAALATPAGAFAPFSARTAFALSEIPVCSGWPYGSSGAQPAPRPLPDVPALILSGADDLRTPASNAEEVAAAIPDAKLLVVPHTGHSVLTDEPGLCASRALQAFFAGKETKQCRTSPPPRLLRPPPLPPRKLGRLSPARHYHGLTGRTLQAVKVTLADFGVQLALELQTVGVDELLSLPSIGVGGLRAGWAKLSGTSIVFHDYSYVPGVTLSGSIRFETGHLVIGGSAAAHGSLRLEKHHLLVGELAGEGVRLSTNSDASAAIVGNDAAASTFSDPRHAGGRRVPERLAGLLGWLLEL